MRNKNLSVFLTVLIALGTPFLSFAQDDTDALHNTVDTAKASRFSLHFQATYIYQYKPEFNAQYSGKNSLSSLEEKENSITATLYLGARLWKGAEIYLNPELAGGNGLSGAFGLAASTNGETFRVGDPSPTLYVARGFFAQTIAIGKGRYENVPEDENETGGNKPKNYLKFYLGKMAISDVFDNNEYANSPRVQFMNWCLMNNGAWDYAANLRGYTYAFVTVLQQGSMTYKAALATLPKVANGADLNTNLSEEYSLNAEIDKTYTLGLFRRKGNIRLLGYYNNGHMGNYVQALQHRDSMGLPAVASTRAYGRTRTGISLNADQQVGNNIGIFLRAGWNDGKNETWAFTEADRTISTGVVLSGNWWKRKDDNLSLGVVVNGLSQDHRDYLAAGGYGFQLGDGRLTYANESALELYYSWKPVAARIWFTGDYQFVLNPGYNSDRGPVNVFSFRLHVEL